MKQGESEAVRCVYSPSTATPGPEITALITGFPSGLFPALVALNASTACSKANLVKTISITAPKDGKSNSRNFTYE